MTLSVRRLAPGDLAHFRAMNALFGEAFDDPDSYASAPPSDAYIARMVDDERFVGLVALNDDEVVGALAAYELRKFEQERSEIYIYDLAVAEAHRRRGIATMLIEWLRGHARGVGAWTIYVQADPPDEPALTLYEKFGRREEVLHFDIAPRPGPKAS